MLSPGMRLAQLVVHQLARPAPLRAGEDDKYVAPVRPQASRLAKERAEFLHLESVGQQLRSRLGENVDSGVVAS